MICLVLYKTFLTMLSQAKNRVYKKFRHWTKEKNEWNELVKTSEVLLNVVTHFLSLT